jgi:hypothetical protein
MYVISEWYNNFTSFVYYQILHNEIRCDFLKEEVKYECKNY